MSETVEKFSEQSVVERALALRAKMATDDSYKQKIHCTTAYENYLKKQATDAIVWDDWEDWDNGG